jgi:NAD(P)-dependent dehydrogenase (short-subunit alcohol dehydrogenase family)
MTNAALMAFDGKVTLVTGAGRGIGSAVAIALGRSGARLHLVGRGEAALAEAAKEIFDAHVNPADVSTDAGIARIAGEIAAGPGGDLAKRAGIGAVRRFEECTASLRQQPPRGGERREHPCHR